MKYFDWVSDTVSFLVFWLVLDYIIETKRTVRELTRRIEALDPYAPLATYTDEESEYPNE